jgi:hypothetical protein
MDVYLTKICVDISTLLPSIRKKSRATHFAKTPSGFLLYQPELHTRLRGLVRSLLPMLDLSVAHSLSLLLRRAPRALPPCSSRLTARTTAPTQAPSLYRFQGTKPLKNSALAATLDAQDPGKRRCVVPSSDRYFCSSPIFGWLSSGAHLQGSPLVLATSTDRDVHTANVDDFSDFQSAYL